MEGTEIGTRIAERKIKEDSRKLKEGKGIEADCHLTITMLPLMILEAIQLRRMNPVQIPLNAHPVKELAVGNPASNQISKLEDVTSTIQVKAGLTESEETREPSKGGRTETEQANLKTMGERDPLKKLTFLKMIFLKELTTTRI